MRRIDAGCSHIEHIKPETLCRAEQQGSDLEYNNLVACFPRDGMSKSYRYGAQKKDDWWDDGGSSFVSPLNAVCEKRFQFNLAGEIKAVHNRKDARITIDVLGLDHPTLEEDRKLAIEQFIYGQSGSSPLSPAQTQQAKNRILLADGDDRFRGFCVAILHALQEYESALQKRAKRRKFAKKKA